jgi:hypothetical protein
MSKFFFAHPHNERFRILLSGAGFPVNATATPEQLEYFQIEAILSCCLKLF